MKNTNFLKHYLLGFIFSLGCYFASFADPGTLTAIGISLAVSAATTAATYLITYLTAPKPKPIDKNKLEGRVQLTNVGEDLDIPEVYGARGSDGKGGVRVGGIIVLMNPIRRIITETSQNAGGSRSGKGGGGGSKQITKERHYYTDLVILCALNRNRILEIKAGTDSIYRNYTPPVNAGTKYQAESAVLSGTAPNADSGFSGGYNVPLNTGDSATFTILGDGKNHAFYLHYYCVYDDRFLNITINGTAHSIPVPNTYGRIESVMIIGSTNIGNTTVFVQSPNDDVWLDYLEVGAEYVSEVEVPEVPRFGWISGLKNSNWENPDPVYDPYTLRDPLEEDWRGSYEYNYQANPNSSGELAASLPSGSAIRIYEGTADQLPDPIVQEYFEAKYGIGSAPAYRHRTTFVLDNFEITKYGSVPNFTIIMESIDFPNLGSMYAHRSERAGLDPETEFDYTDLEQIPLRGFPIRSRQSPRAEMEVLNRIFDLDCYESNEGKIVGVVPGETVIASIPLEDLDAVEGDPDEEGGEEKSLKVLETVVPTEYELPKRMDFSYSDPDKNFDVGSVHAQRQITVSEKRENLETDLTLLQDEAQKIVYRLFQKEWSEAGGEAFDTFYKWGWLNPTDLVEVEDLSGNWNKIRLKARQGNIPGILKFAGVPRNLPEPFPRVYQIQSSEPNLPPWVRVPPHLIGTIFDEVILRSNDDSSGFYAGCVMTDQLYTFQGGSLWWERESGWQLLESFSKQAIIGRTVDGSGGILGNVPGGWNPGDFDAVNSVTFDLFQGEANSANSDAEVLDRENVAIIGNEVIAFRYATRVPGYPSRWTINRLQRKIKGTHAIGHAANDRVILLNDAIKFIDIDPSEYGKTRNYKFVSAGQDLTSASSFSFTWDGLSNPFAAPPSPEIVLTGETLTLNDLTKVKTVKGSIVPALHPFEQTVKVYWKKPGGIYELLTERTFAPNTTNPAEFRADNLANGTHYFKAVSQSRDGSALNTVGDEDSVIVSSGNFVINDKPIENAADRAFTGFDNFGLYRGRDLGIVPLSVITGSVIAFTMQDEGRNVKTEIGGSIIGARVDQTANGDSVFQSSVEMFDKFGISKGTWEPAGFSGSGIMGTLKHPVKDCHPIEEAIFRITVRNYFGWSESKFLHKGALSNSKPAGFNAAQTMKDLAGTALSATVIRLTYNSPIGHYALIQRRKPGGSPDEWVTHFTHVNTDIGARSVDVPDFAIDSVYELRAVSDIHTTQHSNIITVKTKQAGEPEPTYPAPTALNGAPNASDPTHRLDFSFQAKGNVPTLIYKNGVYQGTVSAIAIDATGSFYLDSLDPSTDYEVSIKHDYGSGHLSAPATVTRRTSDPPPPSSSVFISGGYYSEFQERIVLNFSATGSGTIEVFRSVDYGTFENYDIASGSVYYDYGVYQNSFESISFRYFMRRGGVDSGVREVLVRPYDPWGCFLAETPVLMADGTSKPIAQIQEGDQVLAFANDLDVHACRVRRLIEHHDLRRFFRVRFVEMEGSLDLTLEHRFLQPNGEFAAMRNLKAREDDRPGDKVMKFSGGLLTPREWREIEIESIERIEEKVSVYNFEVEDLQTYFANGFAVHNSKA